MNETATISKQDLYLLHECATIALLYYREKLGDGTAPDLAECHRRRIPKTLALIDRATEAERSNASSAQ